MPKSQPSGGAGTCLPSLSWGRSTKVFTRAKVISVNEEMPLQLSRSVSVNQ